MASAKEISVKVIPASIATPFVKKHHYSGKIVNNSKLHFGVFIFGSLHGVMSFGPPLDKSKVLGLVVDKNGNPAPWFDMLELNRMAFDDTLPKNSESRAIAVAVRLIRKYAPNIKWILSFADGMQCGDGTIYRASGFKLTGFSSGSVWHLPEYLWEINGGEYAHRMKVQDKLSLLSCYILRETHGQNLTMEKYAEKFGGSIAPGYMLRYIKILSPDYRLSVPEIPYSAIQEKGACMYKGVKR